MVNKLQALETVIGMTIDAAADVEDLQAIMELLHAQADKLDAKIIDIEENSF